MKHIIQIHLEHKNDVIRDIEIPSDKSLEELHYAIIDALELDKNEMASFYMIDENLDLLQEFPLFKIDEKESSVIIMNEMKIGSVFPNINSQLLYVYDFLKMWRFLISYTKESENKSNTIDIINSIGEMPKESPEVIFKSEKEFDDSENDFEEDFNEPDESEY